MESLAAGRALLHEFRGASSRMLDCSHAGNLILAPRLTARSYFEKCHFGGSSHQSTSRKLSDGRTVNRNTDSTTLLASRCDSAKWNYWPVKNFAIAP